MTDADHTASPPPPPYMAARVRVREADAGHNRGCVVAGARCTQGDPDSFLDESGATFMGEFGIIVHSTHMFDDLGDTFLECQQPPHSSMEQQARADAQCERLVGGVQMRLINSWDDMIDEVRCVARIAREPNAPQCGPMRGNQARAHLN